MTRQLLFIFIAVSTIYATSKANNFQFKQNQFIYLFYFHVKQVQIIHALIHPKMMRYVK